MTAKIEKLEPRYLRAAGDIDHAFGDDGRVIESVDTTTSIDDALLLPDDKLIVAGARSNDHTFSNTNYFLRRYNADGSVDTSFGDQGSVVGRFDPNVAVRFSEIHPTTGGKFVVVARNFSDDDFPQDFFIARFNANGSLDTSFSSDGWLPYAVNFGWVTIAVQNDGAVLVGEASRLTRYTAAGELDTAFGDDGTIVQALGPFGQIFDVKPLADGTILAGGLTNVNNDDNNYLFALAKFNADGSPFMSFGDNGFVTTHVHPEGEPERFEIIRDMMILPDGKILASGEGGGGHGGNLAVVRYMPDGSLDPTFGDGGISIINRGGGWTRMFTDSSGRVYINAGYLTRITATGAVDQTFGRVYGGADARNSDTYAPGAVAGVNSDGKIVFALVREIHQSGPGAGIPGIQDIIQFRRLTEDDGNPSPITFAGGVVTIHATEENDYLHAQDFDVVVADVNGDGRVFELADVDQIFCDGLGGDDVFRFDDVELTPLHLKGGDGRDRIVGGSKNDTLEGNAHSDRIDGGNGADRITGNGGNDRLQGEGGHDRLYGGAGSDGLAGSADNDYLDGGAGPDILLGGSGNDIFLALDGEIDQLFGDAGNDTATADEDDNLVEVETIL